MEIYISTEYIFKLVSSYVTEYNRYSLDTSIVKYLPYRFESFDILKFTDSICDLIDFTDPNNNLQKYYKNIWGSINEHIF